MKRTIFLLMSILLLLTACGDGHKQTSSDKEQSEHKDNHNKNQVKQIATDKKVQGDNYRTILPFKESQARGLLQDNMANGYNGEDFESGLLELSKEIFPTNKYLYQDGQFLEKIAENSPAYLSNILEQDFYGNSDSKGKNIKGMTIGLAMNSVYYYKKEKDGETFSKDLSDKEIEKQGKQMASEMLSRLRENSDLKDIPIHFAIYKQSSQDSITPGEFIVGTTVEEGKTKINSWDNINEKAALIPSSTAADYDETLNNNFKQFNDNLQSYFSNFTQAVGKVKFVNKKAKQLTVDLPIDYYGQAETIGITQYVTEQAEKYFDKLDEYEIRIKDGNTPRALISKTKDDKEPQVHIYHN